MSEVPYKIIYYFPALSFPPQWPFQLGFTLSLYSFINVAI